MKLAITGHTNIEKAVGLELKYPNGSNYDKNAFEQVYTEIETGLKSFCKEKNIDFQTLTLISGMARGVDEVFAIVAIRNNLELILSIPGSIHWHKNRGLSRDMRAQAVYYDKILKYEKLTEKYEISKNYNGETFYLVNLARNQHMVDIADGVFCFKAYDSTGTDDCIKRAKKKGNFLGNLHLN
jgi:hypothetical protein